MVKLKLAQALRGKRLVMIPTGKGANLQTLNVNDLINVKAKQKVTK